MCAEWPLVGRDGVLAVLQEALATASRSVVLAGEAGVGKTRLARESLALAATAGRSVAWAQGTHSAQSIPFGALAHLLPPLLPPAGTRQNLLRQAAESLLQPAGASPFVLGLDDAHLLDDFSAALAHHLVAAGLAGVVAVVRAGESAPDAVTALWKDDLAQRLDIEPLALDEVCLLVSTVLGAPVEGATCHRLFRSTRGLPLLLRELVLSGESSGQLARVEGVWHWTGPLTTSSRLRELIEGRLRALDDRARHGLDVVATVEAVEADLAEEVVRAATGSAVPRCELLEQIADGRRRRIALVHPLHGEVIRESMAPSRTRSILRDLATALEARGGRRREDLLRMVTWRLDAGEPVDAGLALRAARHALAILDFSLALRIAQAGCDRRDVATGLVEAEALAALGRFDDAEAVFERLTPVAANDTERAQVALALAHLLAHTGELDRALTCLGTAEDVLSDEGARQELRAMRSYLLLHGGDGTSAVLIGLALYESPDLSERAFTWAVGAAAGGLLCAGRSDQGLALLETNEERILGVLNQTALAPLGIDLYRWLGQHLAGRFVDAAALAEDRRRHLAASGVRWATGHFAGAEGMSLRAEGKVRLALPLLREAVVAAREQPFFDRVVLFLAELAQCLALAGQPGQARLVLEEIERLPGAAGFAAGHVWQAEVWTAAAAGEVSRAITLALQGADALVATGFEVQRAWLLHDVARLGRARLVVDPILPVLAAIDGPLAPAIALHVTGLAETKPLLLEKAADLFERETGALVLAAEALAAAAGMWADQGANVRSHEAAKRAESLVLRCPDVRTPALRALEGPSTLTAREREVADLAARGLPSRQIAHDLAVSVRTVDNHLSRVYAKLGVTGRRELLLVRDD